MDKGSGSLYLYLLEDTNTNDHDPLFDSSLHGNYPGTIGTRVSTPSTPMSVTPVNITIFVEGWVGTEGPHRRGEVKRL